MYVGVDFKPQYHGILTRHVLALLTGDPVQEGRKAEDCETPGEQDLFELIFLKTESVPEWWEGDRASCNKSAECGACFKTLSFRRPAISPAFVIEG